MTPTTRSAAELMPLLPELVLLGGAFALLMLDLFLHERQRIVTHVLAIGVIVAATLMAGFGTGGEGVVLSEMFVRDTASNVIKVAIGTTAAFAMAYMWSFLRDRGLYKGEVAVLVLFATLGMFLLASANSLVMVYLGLEMLALCSYALVAIDRDSPLASEAAIKYFVLGSLASGLLLYGLSLIYGATGSLDLSTVANAAAAQPTSMLVTGVVFAVAGIAFKFGAAPFHMWLPDVYHGAPTPVTLFIGSAPKLGTFAMTYRVLEVAAGPLDDRWRILLAGLAVASLAIGNLSALVQTNFKRLLAYSTVSHVGFLFLGFAGGGEQGFAAALFYAISYALMSVAAFGVIVVMAKRGFEADEIADYKGLNARSPALAALILCVMASLAGLPPFLGFWAKLAVIRAAVEGGMIWLALVGVVFAVVGAYYYLRVVKAMYFDEPEGAPHAGSPNRPLRLVFGINALGLLVLGLAWNPIWAWCQRAFAG